MENRLIKVAKRLASLWKASRQLRVGLLLFLGVLLVAILAGVLSPYAPYYLSDDLLMPPGSENHPLGTDHMGHDVLSMILHGSRTSLTIGIVSALISGLIGTMLGAFAGYFGGALDKITSEVINIFLMIPTFFLVLIIVSIFGSNMFNVMLVIGLTSWPSNARMMRVQAMSLKERTYNQGRGGHGRKPVADSVQVHHPQRPVPGHRQHHHGRGQGDPDGGQPFVSGSGRPQHRQLGPDGV